MGRGMMISGGECAAALRSEAEDVRRCLLAIAALPLLAGAHNGACRNPSVARMFAGKEKSQQFCLDLLALWCGVKI